MHVSLQMAAAKRIDYQDVGAWQCSARDISSPPSLLLILDKEVSVDSPHLVACQGNGNPGATRG
jgi:hypothetical protein